MGELGALATFAFIAAITPGPNNVMLWASGVQFGIRNTLPHMLGIVSGVGTMAILAAVGLAAFIEAFPPVETGLKLVGSAYLLYLAVQISGLRASSRAAAAKPLTLLQGLMFQYVNPKAWVFVLTAVATFRPEQWSAVMGSIATAGTIMIVVFPCNIVWTAGGTVLNRFFTGERSRVLSVSLALLLAATVVYIWL